MSVLLALLFTSVLAGVSVAVPGGFFALEDTEVQPVAEFAVQRLGPGYSLVEVLDRKAQLVAGILYHLTLKVEKTEANETTQVQTCFVEVHVRSWVNFKEVTSSHCRPFTSQDVRKLPEPVAALNLAPQPGVIQPSNSANYRLAPGPFGPARTGPGANMRNGLGNGRRPLYRGK